MDATQRACATAAYQHGITHRAAPLRWDDGFPLGNGVLGAMCWGGGNPLAFTLDHADLWDLRRNFAFMDDPRFNYATLRRLVAAGRFDEAQEVFEAREWRDNPVGPTKISLGRAELALSEPASYTCHLDLERAAVSGTIRTVDGTTHALRAFVHQRHNILCLQVDALPEKSRMRVIPLAEMSDSLARLGHPAPRLEEDGRTCLLLQQIPDGCWYALAWNPQGPDIYLAVEIATQAESARAAALASWEAAAGAGFDRLLAEHLAAWESFWTASAIALPDATMEFLWYYGIYLLASSARRSHCPPGLQGLWAMDGVMPPWRGDYHADLNVQETFWPSCATGHLELLDVWCDYMRAVQPQARVFTRRFFGSEGTFWPACTIPGFTSVPSWHTVQYGWSHTGWLGWLVWLRWRYSLDTGWLADTGYPLVADIFRFYRANLEREADGFLHVPLSSSPEYKENTPAAWAKDPNIDLALIRRCSDWVVEMENALGIAELCEEARAVRSALVPYALTAEKVLSLSPGKPLDESHRHPSQLMAIHPAMDLTLMGDANTQEIIRASVEQYLSLGQWRWAGHTYAQLISFAAVLGRAGWAYDCVRQLAEHWLGPNGLHFNADISHSGMSVFSYGADGTPPFTMEANNAVSAGLSDMLVQGWGDTLRVFPAIPAQWRDAAFRDLLTEGAFRVSAIRRQGKTRWVRIVATVDRVVRLRDPFAGTPCRICGGELHREGDLYVGQLAAWQAVTLQCGDEACNWDAVVLWVHDGASSRFGLHEAQGQ